MSDIIIYSVIGGMVVYAIFLHTQIVKLLRYLDEYDNALDENDEFVVRVAEKFTEYDRFIKDQATENNATYDRVKSHYIELSEQLKIDNKSITNIIQAIEALNKKVNKSIKSKNK